MHVDACVPGGDLSGAGGDLGLRAAGLVDRHAHHAKPSVAKPLARKSLRPGLVRPIDGAQPGQLWKNVARADFVLILVLAVPCGFRLMVPSRAPKALAGARKMIAPVGDACRHPINEEQDSTCGKQVAACSGRVENRLDAESS